MDRSRRFSRPRRSPASRSGSDGPARLPPPHNSAPTKIRRSRQCLPPVSPPSSANARMSSRRCHSVRQRPWILPLWRPEKASLLRAGESTSVLASGNSDRLGRCDFHRDTTIQHDDDPTLYRGAKLTKGTSPSCPGSAGHACGALSQGGTLLASLTAMSPVPLGITHPSCGMGPHRAFTRNNPRVKMRSDSNSAGRW